MAVWAFMASHRENFIVIVFGDVINKLDKYLLLFLFIYLFFIYLFYCAFV